MWTPAIVQVSDSMAPNAAGIAAQTTAFQAGNSQLAPIADVNRQVCILDPLFVIAYSCNAYIV